MEWSEDGGTRFRRWWRRDGKVLVLLLLAITVFHWRGIRPGRTFLPVDLANNSRPWLEGAPGPLENWLISDPLYQYYPFLEHGVRALQDLRWPLWNPDIMLGHPVLADPVAQPFYPVALVAGLLFGPARGLALALWIQVLLAAVLTYGWLRSTGRSPVAAAGGALSYVLGGYLVTWFETTFWVSTLSLLPGVLWALEAAVQKRRLVYVSLAGLLFGLAILGGQLQFIGTFTIFLGLYALGHALVARGERRRSAGWPLLALALVVALGALLSAVATAPFVEFLALSRRVAVRGLEDPLPLVQLLTLLVPNYFGNPATGRIYWGSGNYSEYTIYAGVVALYLATLAPFASRRFFTRYMALLVLLAVYAIVGGPGISLFSAVPGLKYVSLHRSAFLLPLLVSFLSASTLDARTISRRAVLGGALLLSAIPVLAFVLDVGAVRDYWRYVLKEMAASLALVFGALLLLWARQRFAGRRKAVSWLLVLLIFADLFRVGYDYNPAGKVTELMRPTPALDYLQAHSGLHRLATLQLDDEILFGPNVPQVFQLSEAGGYSSLVLERYHQLVAAGDPIVDLWWMDRNANTVMFSNPSRQLLDLFQVAHVASPRALPDWPAIRAEQVSEGCEATTRTVSSQQPLRGDFTVRDTAINRVDFRVALPQGSPAGGQLTIRIAEGGRLVAESSVDAASLQDGQILTLFFAPEREAPRKGYAWEIGGDQRDSGVALCLDAGGAPAVSVYGSDWTTAYEGEIVIYERTAPLPRAYVVYAAQHVGEDREAVAELLDPAFPLWQKAVTAEPVGLPPDAPEALTPATIVSYEETRVVIQATAVREGLLVLGDQFYPGWEVTVDGERASITRTNQIFRGVLLPAGDHEVIFVFRPPSLELGLGITLVGGLLALGLAAAERRKGGTGWGTAPRSEG